MRCRCRPPRRVCILPHPLRHTLAHLAAMASTAMVAVLRMARQRAFDMYHDLLEPVRACIALVHRVRNLLV